IGFIMIMLAILSNGGREGIKGFIDIASIFVVIGGLIGSLLINFKYEQIKLFNKVMKEAFQKNDYDMRKIIQLFVHLSTVARKEGLLALEMELDGVEDPFIRKGILLAVDGVEPEVINEILDAEIIALEDRQYR